MTFEQLIDFCVSETRRLLQQAEAEYQRSMPKVEILFDLKGQSAGMVQFPVTGVPVIRYNRVLLQENGLAFVDHTPAHEVAHVVARTLFGRKIRPHGSEWRAVMRHLGAVPDRCHRFDTSRSSNRQYRRFPYRCGCRQHMLTSIRRNRIQRGQSYHCRDCGDRLYPGLFTENSDS